MLIQLSILIKNTIPSDSTIEYSVDDGQTWNILNSNNDIPTVSTVTEAENTKIFIRISNSNSNDDTWTSQEYKAIIKSSNLKHQIFHHHQIPKYSVPWSCKKVSDITTISSSNTGIWQDTDQINRITSWRNLSLPTAVYNGTDKGNYVTETVTYTITRKECEHKNTVGRLLLLSILYFQRIQRRYLL